MRKLEATDKLFLFQFFIRKLCFFKKVENIFKIKRKADMKLYIQGFITGALLISSFFTFTASDNPQIDAIEKEIMKIWDKENTQDQLIRNNESKALNLESDISIHSKSINLFVQSLQKQIDKLTNQLNEHCECYRNQILMN